MTSGPGSRLRRLSAEEIALWAEVARSVVPRPGVRPPAGAAARAPTPEPRPLPAAEPPPVPRPPPLAPLDPRLRQKLRRGRAEIDAVLDLHGFRAAEAHLALRRFLDRAQRDGAQLVLVVTGKGRLAPEGEGVLRRSVPLWLGAPELRRIVVGFEEAGRTHGGGGALYVRLRRRDRPAP
jgi:DNA-nicking Smr family endonuclease